jgi:oleate hydratase
LTCIKADDRLPSDTGTYGIGGSRMKAHIVGGGIAGLAAAAHLVRDAGVPGADVTVYEAGEKLGGALDASGEPQSGYCLRGGRMFEDRYLCTAELLGFIPSSNDPEVAVADDTARFSTENSWEARSRLVGAGGRILDTRFGLTLRDRADLAKLSLRPESSLDGVRIADCFRPAFFDGPFWLMFSTIFAFLPWHGAMEMRRYLHRFIHILPALATMTMVRRTRFNQYESIVRPLAGWLARAGVRIRPNTRVTRIDFAPGNSGLCVERLHLTAAGADATVAVAPSDPVFVTLGSKVADATCGSMTAPPARVTGRRDGAWDLWHSLAGDRKDFGNPAAFDGDIPASAWMSFTVTECGRRFFDRIEAFSGRPAGCGGLITLTASNWLVTISLLRHPHFIGQPDDVEVWWGDGLYIDRPGNFVAKPMTDCTGAEIVEEVLLHLGFADDLPAIAAASTVIPCLMPYAGSVFLPRRRADRPPVLPRGSVNLALIGQYVELPADVAYTVEYSIRSARIAAAGLVPGVAPPPPVYRGGRDPRVLREAVRALWS